MPAVQKLLCEKALCAVLPSPKLRRWVFIVLVFLGISQSVQNFFVGDKFLRFHWFGIIHILFFLSSRSDFSFLSVILFFHHGAVTSGYGNGIAHIRQFFSAIQSALPLLFPWYACCHKGYTFSELPWGKVRHDDICTTDNAPFLSRRQSVRNAVVDGSSTFGRSRRMTASKTTSALPNRFHIGQRRIFLRKKRTNAYHMGLKFLQNRRSFTRCSKVWWGEPTIKPHPTW